MRVASLAHRGAHLWRRAGHMGKQLDRGIHNAAYLRLHAIQPGLWAAGVDTRHMDQKLNTNYGHYNKLPENMRNGIEVMDGIAAHLRGGTFSYP